MKVKELIEKLKRLDPEAIVVVNYDCHFSEADINDIYMYNTDYNGNKVLVALDVD